MPEQYLRNIQGMHEKEQRNIKVKATTRLEMDGKEVFIGSVLLLLIYALIIQRVIAIGRVARNSFARLYCYLWKTVCYFGR